MLTIPYCYRAALMRLLVLIAFAGSALSLPPLTHAQDKGLVLLVNTDGTGGLMAHSLTAVSNAPKPRNPSALLRWSIVLEDSAGDTVWSTAVADPLRGAALPAAEASLPVPLVFADAPDAALVRLVDEAGQTRLMMMLDAGVRERAEARRKQVGPPLLPRLPKAHAQGSTRHTALSRQLRHTERNKEPHCETCVPELQGTMPVSLDATGRSAAAPPAAVTGASVHRGKTADDRLFQSGFESGEGLVRLSVQLVDATGQPITHELYVGAIVNSGEWMQLRTTGEGSLPLDVPRASRVFLYIYGFPSPFPAVWSDYLQLVGIGNVTWRIPVPTGVDLQLRLLPQGAALPRSLVGHLYAWRPDTVGRARSVHWFGGVSFDGTGHAPVFRVPIGWDIDLYLDPPPPFLPLDPVRLGRFYASGTAAVPLERGVVLSGSIGSSAGSALTALEFLLYDADRQRGNGRFWTDGEFDGEYAFVLRPGFFRAGVRSALHAPHAAGFDLQSDRTYHVELQRDFPVEFELRGPEHAVAHARVEILRGGAFVKSVRLNANGQADTRLVAGEYQALAWPDTQAASWGPLRHRLFAGPALRIAFEVVDGPTRVQGAIAPGDFVRMGYSLDGGAPLGGCDAQAPYGRLELQQGQEVVARTAPSQHPLNRSLPFVIGAGGPYRLRASVVGGVVFESAPFVPTADATVVLRRTTLAPRREWSGRLLSSALLPIAGQRVVAYEPFQPAALACTSTDSAGRFRIPLCEGCVYAFAPPQEGDDFGKYVRITDANASIDHDVVLDGPLRLPPLDDAGATLLYGDPTDRSRINLLFIAEGYTAVREQFTDRNGNGVWDGIYYFDINLNGVWDPGEPFARHGEAPPPVAGTDPRQSNEPFDDLNGDGVLSIDDAALFHENVRNYLRSLLAGDVFAEYRERFNVYAIAPASGQVGTTIDGVVVRNTLFKNRYTPERSILEIDYAAASVFAAEALPEADLLVVMINQEIPIGRVTSWVLGRGGYFGNNPMDTVAVHEFGHRIGGLADEYEELYGESPYMTVWSPNIATFIAPEVAPWSPSGRHGHRVARDFEPGVGFFEGGEYSRYGVFRPTLDSVMRGGNPLFNPPSRMRLEQRLAAPVHASDTPQNAAEPPQ